MRMTLPRPVFPSASFFQPSLLLACAASLVAGLATQGAQAQSPPRAVQPVQAGASAPCAQGLVKLGPGAQVGTVTLCSEVERQVPQLGITLAQLQKQLSGQDQVMAEMLRLLRQVNAASVLAGQQQVEMARSLDKRLAQAAAQPPSAALRAVRALGDEMEQVAEDIHKVAQDDSKRDAYQSLRASIQESLGALELKRTNALLGSVDKLQKTLEGVGEDVAVIRETGDDTRNITLFSEAQRTRARGDQGQARVLGVFVAQGKSFEGQDLAGMGFSRAKAPRLRARDSQLMLTWWDGADLTGADLQDATLIAAKLERTQLDGANLDGARALFARAQGASLAKANLTRSNWAGADLRGANLSGAKLVGAGLVHADLRDADLRGADLTGAFLSGADLRGARLEGAVLRNTEAGLALLPRTALSAAQYAGLCATPTPVDTSWAMVRPRGVAWEAVERIPNPRFDGGYEHRKILAIPMSLGLGGHRPYPRCQPRTAATQPATDLPLWDGKNRNGEEEWRTEQSFRVPHAVAEGSRRREELKAVLEAARDAVAARAQAQAEIPQYGEFRTRLYRAMDERLAALTHPVQLPASLRMDKDTTVMWALRLRPEVLEHLKLDWTLYASSGLWGDLGLDAVKRGSGWPRLFPDGMLLDDLGETTTRAFMAWTKARAAAVGRTPVSLEVRWDNLKPGQTWAQVLSANNGDPSYLTRRLGLAQGQVIVGHIGGMMGNDVDVGVGTVIEGDVAALAAWAARNSPKPDERLLATVQDLSWLPRQQPEAYGGGPYLVWRLRVLLPPDRPAAHASPGSTVSARP